MRERSQLSMTCNSKTPEIQLLADPRKTLLRPTSDNFQMHNLFDGRIHAHMSHIVWNRSIFRVFVIHEHIVWLGNACFACHCRSFCVTIAVTVVIGYVRARLVGYTFKCTYVRRSLFRFAIDGTDRHPATSDNSTVSKYCTVVRRVRNYIF
jgi:hypothetical protein